MQHTCRQTLGFTFAVVVYLQILKTTTNRHPSSAKCQIKHLHLDTALLTRAQVQKVYLTTLKSVLLIDYQEYNADLATKHIAQPDFIHILLVINSAKGFF